MSARNWYKKRMEEIELKFLLLFQFFVIIFRTLFVFPAVLLSTEQYLV